MIWAKEIFGRRKESAVKRVTGRFVVGSAIFLLLIGAAAPQTSQAPLKILISNDDGFDAPGLATLVEHLSKIGTVTVAAPSQEASGSSHSVTSADPILVTESEKNGSKWYNIKATPATCVRLALESLLADKPDLVVTGINKGQNMGTVTFYSATIGAAREAAFKGIPAIAVNLVRGQKMDYGPAAEFIVDLIRSLKDKPLKPGTFLNVNVPNLPKNQIKGVLVVPQDLRAPIEFYEKRVNPSGQVYYWNSYKHHEPGTDKTDVWALRNGYITITPLSIDQTNYEELNRLDSLKIGGWKK
jgi:5'-nucleotidase